MSFNQEESLPALKEITPIKTDDGWEYHVK